MIGRLRMDNGDSRPLHAPASTSAALDRSKLAIRPVVGDGARRRSAGTGRVAPAHKRDVPRSASSRRSRSVVAGPTQRFDVLPRQELKPAFTRRTRPACAESLHPIRTRAPTPDRAPPPARLRSRRSLPSRCHPHTPRLRRPDTALRRSRSGNRPCDGSGSATTCASPRR